MKKKTRNILLSVLTGALLLCAIAGGTVYYYLFAPQFHPSKTVYVYVDRDDTADSIYNKIRQTGHVNKFTGFQWMAKYRKFDQNIHTGRYAIRPNENVYHVFSRFFRGYQEPMNLTIGSVRTLDRLARSIGKQLMIDSAEIARQLFDSAFQAEMGYTLVTMPCLFIPETYQVYWDMSVDDFFKRMQTEHKRFWNDERLAQATAIGMTPEEVCTLASIVEEETNNNEEKPMVAGLYINEVCSSGTDWVELYNSSDAEISLSGFRLQDNKGADEEYVFPMEAKIAANGFLVLEKDTHFGFGISGSGDEIKLLDASYKQIDDIMVPPLEDGQTYARTIDGGREWNTMSAGTKGRANTSTPDEGGEEQPGESAVSLLINEVMSAPLDGGFDFVEIYNPGMTEVDMGGFILQDDKGVTEQYVIPEGTKIVPNAVVCFTQAQAGNPSGSFGFGLSSKGDKVVFLDKDGNCIDQVELPAMEKGTSYARTVDGAATWGVCINPTQGQSNGSSQAPTLRGVVFINEVYTFSDQSDINDLDYIELYNASSHSVSVAGCKLWEGGGPEEAWTIPAGKTIPAKGYLVIECDKENLYHDPVNYPSWGLSKNSETVILADTQGSGIIDQVDTPNMSKGEAYGRKTDGASEWVIFAELTRGTTNNGADEKQDVANTSGVYINEVFTNNQDVQVSAWDDTKDFIELYNATGEDIDLTGFSLNDDALKEEKKYIFPAGSVIRAKSFLTLDVDKNSTTGPVFGLGKGGDKVFLWNTQGVLVDEVETPEFADNEIYSTGRKTDGSPEVVVFTEVSKNASNNGRDVK